MIQVFVQEGGSGKTKRLIDLANTQVAEAKGIQYILMMIQGQCYSYLEE